MFNIFRATENDIQTIREIAERTWWPAYSPILSAEQIEYMLRTIYAADSMKQDMAGGGQIFLVLRDEEGAQAFASYGRRLDEPGVYKLHKLYVLPEKQDKGYGKALIDEITDRLQQDGIHALDLNVNRMNPALGFYEKKGFKIIREEDIPIGPFWMNDYVMRLEF